MCRNWENGYCQYDTKVSWLHRASLSKILFIHGSNFEFLFFSARLLTGGTNFKSVTIYRKIIKPSFAKSSTGPNTTAATDRDAHSYIHDRSPHPPLRPLLSILPQQTLFRIPLFIIIANLQILAPVIRIVITSAGKIIKNCPHTVTI